VKGENLLGDTGAA